ncbi:hypothetical protein M0802_002683 [Mischocyttarus mexicanus]|nr:hypothetical protein M0802_002683 [Mischocyttarus mexicanus]
MKIVSRSSSPLEPSLGKDASVLSSISREKHEITESVKVIPPRLISTSSRKTKEWRSTEWSFLNVTGVTGLVCVEVEEVIR